MEFKERQAIYIQIADYICESILTGEWNAEAKIPSIREMAVSIEVNPNTVMRTYNYLQEKGIIHNQRGIGYFVAKDAHERILKLKKEMFVSTELPNLFKTIDILQLDFKEIERMYKLHKQEMEAS